MLTRADILAAESVTAVGEVLRADFTVTGADDLGSSGTCRVEQALTKAAKRTVSGLGYGDVQIEDAAYANGAGTCVVSGFTKSSLVFSHRQNGTAWVHENDLWVESVRRVLRDAVRRERPQATVSAQWTPGSGVAVESAETDGSAAIRLRLNELKRYDGRVLLLRRLGVAYAIALGIIAAVLMVRGALMPAVVVALYGSPGLLSATLLSARQTDIRARVRELNERLDLAELLDEEQRRAHKLFSVNNLELQRYYDQALRQRARVFALGLVCILGGFGAIGGALYVLRDYEQATMSEKLLVAGLGSISGILANFIAVVFLQMFSRTVQSMVDLHNRLVVTHHVHFGNVLTARIEDESLRDRTLSEMALALAHHEHAVKPTSPAAPA